MTMDARTAGMFLPQEVFDNLPERRHYVELHPYLTGLLDRIDAENEHHEWKRQRKWLLNAKYFANQQLGEILPDGDWLNAQTLSDGSRAYQENYFTGWIGGLLKEYIKMRPRVEVAPTDDLRQTEMGADFGQDAVEVLLEQTFAATFQQREWLRLLLFGNTFRYTYWLEGDEAVKVPLTGRHRAQIPTGLFSCPTCGPFDERSVVAVPRYDQESANPGQEASDMAHHCPECGEEAVPQFHDMQVESVIGYETRKTGQVKIESVSPFEMKFDLRALRFTDSRYIRRSRLLPVELLREMFPFVPLNLPGTVGGGDELEHQDMLRGASGSLVNELTSSDGYSSFRQYWLKPYVYGDWCDETKDTPIGPKGSGIVIPKGMKLREVFPDGLYLARVGGKMLVDARNENGADHWTGCSYRLHPEQLWGDSSEALRDAQDVITESLNLGMEHLGSNSNTITTINPAYVEPDDVTGEPGNRVVLKNQGVSDPTFDLGKSAINRLPATGLPATATLMSENAKRLGQHSSGAFAINAGDPNVDVKTATGMTILRNATLSNLGPSGELYGEMVLESAKQGLLQFHRNAIDHAKGIRRDKQKRKYGMLKTSYFAASNVKTSYRVSLVENSTAIRGPEDERNDIMDFTGARNLPGGLLNPELPERLRKRAAQLWHMEQLISDDHADERHAYIRLSTMLQACAMADAQGMGSLPDGTINAAGVDEILSITPLDLVLDDHAVHISFLRDWLLEDDGLQASPFTQAVVKARILEHYHAQVQQKQFHDALVAQSEVMNVLSNAAATGVTAPPPAPPGAAAGAQPTL